MAGMGFKVTSRSLGLAVTMGLALSASACSIPMVPETVDPPAEAVETAAAESDAVEEFGADPMEESGGWESPVFRLGDRVEYEDGLALTADVVAETVVSEVGSSDCVQGEPVVVVELTVENGTSYTVNPYDDFMGSLFMEYEDADGYAVSASKVFDNAQYNGGYELSAGQEFATLRPGQTGKDLYGFCVSDMAEGSMYLSVDPTLYEEPEYRDPAVWTETGSF